MACGAGGNVAELLGENTGADATCPHGKSLIFDTQWQLFMYGFTDTVIYVPQGTSLLTSLHSTQLARHTLSAGRSRTRRRPGGALLEPLAVKFYDIP